MALDTYSTEHEFAGEKTNELGRILLVILIIPKQSGQESLAYESQEGEMGSPDDPRLHALGAIIFPAQNSGSFPTVYYSTKAY